LSVENIMKTKTTKTMDPREKALLLARIALQKKPLDPVLLDVQEACSFSDFFLILGGTSTRQTQALADHIKGTLAKQGIYPRGVEGQETAHWILLDYGEVIVHIFFDPARSFYDLEGLWIDAPRLELQ
jgi:ribosome-associated protein